MEPVVRTSHGRVRGVTSQGVTRFLGIPFADGPRGPARFRPPTLPEPWDGVRPALELGPTPLSPGYRPPVDEILYQPTIPGTDCLSVNVWTPDPTGGGLPVMVWIYGGAFTNGNTAIPMYDGQAFARDGVVLVTFNYRLGVEGFALLPGVPANRGILDQLAALRWVRENIAAFGGDPDRVTVFGESAGAMSVTTLLALPAARGLFARAITQSGAAQAAADPDDAALVTAELARRVGGDVSPTALAEIDRRTLVTTQRDVSEALTLDPDPERFGASIVASSMAFIPVVDGDLLPTHPLAAFEAGASSDVPLLAGTTAEEFRFFLVPQGVAAATTEERLEGFVASRGLPPTALDVYRAARPHASPGDLLAAVLTDGFFRLPALAMVEARHRSPSWVYEFAWRTTHRDLGAAHAVDIPFVFDNLRAVGAEGLVGPDAPQSLADQMHATWVRFAAEGDPGWEPYGGERKVRVFDETGARTVPDPRGEERAAWR